MSCDSEESHPEALSVVSEPSLRAMSAFTAGSLQPQLAALGWVVRFILTNSSSTCPRPLGKDAVRKASVSIWESFVQTSADGWTGKGQSQTRMCCPM